STSPITRASTSKSGKRVPRIATRGRRLSTVAECRTAIVCGATGLPLRDGSRLASMRAVQLIAPGSAIVVEVDEPEGDTVVRSETMGICGTDVKVLHGDLAVDLPRIMGHELVGRVVTSSDQRLRPGTRVLADPA